MSEYKRKTRLLGLPVAWYGDKLHPETELKKFQVIENLLIAGTQGVRNVVFDDGDFAMESVSDGVCEVVLRATGASPSAEGIVGGAYFKAPPELRWTPLKHGSLYYLYLRGDSDVFVDPTKVRTVVSGHILSRRNSLLIATADLRGGTGSVEPYPDGKVYSTDIARHGTDSENPHGRTLSQDELVIRNRLTLGAAVDLEFQVDGSVCIIPAASLVGLLGEVAEVSRIVDFVSGGPGGVVVTVPDVAKVVHATVQRRKTGALTGTLGDVALGYNGQDAKVDRTMEFAVYNTGDAGLPLRALVQCRR